MATAAPARTVSVTWQRAVLTVRAEALWIAVIAVLAFLANNLPRWWAAIHVAPGQVYVGTIWAGPDASWMAETVQQAIGGHLLSSARALGQPDNVRVLQYAPLALLGWLFGRVESDPIVVLGWARLVAQPLALGAVALLVHTALPEGRRAWGYFIAVLAGGVGFLFLSAPSSPVGRVLPLDVTGPSFNVLNSLHMQATVAWDLAGIAIFAWGFLKAMEGDRRGYWGLVGVAVAGTTHPWALLAPLAGAVLVAFARRRRSAIAYVVLSGLAAAPYGIYLLFSPLRSLTTFQSAAEFQNVPSLVTSGLFVLPLVAIGAVRAVRLRSAGDLFFVGWLTISLLLGLLPWFAAGPLHRTLEGRSVAVGILGAQGVMYLAPRWRAYLAAACVISPAIQLPLLFYFGLHASELYLGRGDLALARRMDADQVHGAIVSDTLTMEWVVSYSQVRAPSSDIWSAGGAVDLIAAAPAGRQAGLLAAAGANYLFWGDKERKLHGDPPAGLRVVMQAGGSYLLAAP